MTKFKRHKTMTFFASGTIGHGKVEYEEDRKKTLVTQGKGIKPLSLDLLYNIFHSEISLSFRSGHRLFGEFSFQCFDAWPC